MQSSLNMIAVGAFLLLLVTPACQAAPTPEPTSAPAPPTHTSAPTPTPTETPRPTKTPTPTVTPNATATQNVENMLSLVRQHFEAGEISTTEGEYQKLKDWGQAWAQMDWYQWTRTGVNAKDFILRADFEWDSASRVAEKSGCGFVFRSDREGHHYMVYLDRTGAMMLYFIQEPYSHRMDPLKWDKPEDLGSGPYQAEFALVVEGDLAYVYLDNVLHAKYGLLGGDNLSQSGEFAYTVKSGTNKDYGTRCRMSNVQLWVIER